MRFLIALMLLAGCSNGARIGSGDVADALTTIEVINNPAYVEVGTAPDGIGGVGGAAVLLAQKYVVKVVLIEAGVEPAMANRTVDTVGWYWACQNLALFAGVEPVARVIIGGACALAYWDYDTKKAEVAKLRNLQVGDEFQGGRVYWIRHYDTYTDVVLDDASIWKISYSE